jgi:NADH-quinone oxidoreductase subunit M
MSGFPLLSALILVPVLGALAMLLLPGDDKAVARQSRMVALVTTIIVFALSVQLWLGFDSSTSAFQFVEKLDMFGGAFAWHVGVDGISMLLIVLTAFLMPLCILASWESIETRVREYMIAFLMLEALMIGVFAALDMVLFYILFEGGLIPMYLIIGVWGGKRRIYASFKFFLYTLGGSVLMLLAMLYMINQAGTTSIPDLMANRDTFASVQNMLWLAFFASFAVKMPMWPVHTWLPDAHVEAPTAGSVILAGVLLKMGGYGFLRFSLPMFPEASHYLAPIIFVLSIVAVIYTSLVALVQEDMKKLIAYSSVAHMAFVTIGLFIFNQQGIEGAIFTMLSHGVVSGALFLCVGVIYDRMHTREISAYGGLVHRMPKYALIFMIFTMASIGLPGTSGFVGEFLVLIGAYKADSLLAFLAATGVILGAAYMLWLYRKVIFGELTKEKLKSIMDLSPREIAIFAPLVVLVFWMGIYPNSFLKPLHEPVKNLLVQTGAKPVAVAVTAADAKAALAKEAKAKPVIHKTKEGAHH